MLYPAFVQATGEHARIAAHREDHQAVTALIQELYRLTPDQPHFHARTQTLIDTVARHIAVEEAELFPAAAEVLADRLAALTIEMQVLKRKLLP